MNKRKFMYSQKTQRAKGPMKVFCVLPLFLIPLLLISNDFKSILEFFSAFLVPLLMTFSCVYYLGSWADLEIADDGIYIEFLWKTLHVPWNSIIKIKSSGFGFVRTDTILGDNHYLTGFHRIYGLLAFGLLQPAFHIHPHYLESHELFQLIQKYRASS